MCFAPKLKDEALVAAVEEFLPDVLVVRSTKVPEAVLAAGALKLVVRAGAGYNTIDVAAASRRGIYVSNCPGQELGGGGGTGIRPDSGAGPADRR